MKYDCIYIPHAQTGSFSSLVVDYLDGDDALKPFYNYTPDDEGIKQAIADRAKYPVNRQVLANTLEQQYRGYDTTEAVQKNLAALEDENTYTICTAHQPNLLTGYLYFIYKIAHAIKLADELNTQYPDKHFVPVYFMGNEDNDLEELGRFNYNGESYIWDGDGQTGAVGRMNTASLKPILDDLYRKLGPPGEHTTGLKELLSAAYLAHDTIGAATRYLVNKLFGAYGLIVLDPDEAAFKHEISDVIKDDLLNHTAKGIVGKQAEELEEHYSSQAYARDINLFYLKDNIRERIERPGDTWAVLNTDISWNKQELLNEVSEHPERFSPNVILRGVFQERILPNVAFIGGGSEVAYWMELNKLFAHYNTFFPVVVLRQSVLWIEPEYVQLMQKTGLSIEQVFETTDNLCKAYVQEHSGHDMSTANEQKQFEALLSILRDKAAQIDPTLEQSAEAVLTKINYQLTVLEKKMMRAEKRNHDTGLQRIKKLKEALYPGGSLQERKENFITYYTKYGQQFIDAIIECSTLTGDKFLVTSVS